MDHKAGWDFEFPEEVYATECTPEKQRELMLTAFPGLRIYMEDVARQSKVNISPEAKGVDAEMYRAGASLVAVNMVYDKDYQEKLSKAEDKASQGKASMLANILAFIDPNGKHKDFCMAVMLLHDMGKVQIVQKQAGFKDYRVTLHDTRLPKILRTMFRPEAVFAKASPSIFSSLPIYYLDPITELWEMGFDLAQYNQGEAPVDMIEALRGYISEWGSDEERMARLKLYLAHAIFDVAGAMNNDEKGMIPTLFIPPIVNRFLEEIQHLLKASEEKKDAESIYIATLLSQIKDEEARKLIEAAPKDAMLPVLRLLAMNRFADFSPATIETYLKGLATDVGKKLCFFLGPKCNILLYYSPFIVQKMIKEKVEADKIIEELVKFFEVAQKEKAILYNVQNPKDIVRAGDE
eukprot:gb/GEZN01004959.1/.p1 GENE.gb/GEZN01004959.1/~~gb/GEZN01004959.1/.p1  ORF type:complete len:407 (-),score=72.16 gb/GEZN01004959.1/:512-1732(-)